CSVFKYALAILLLASGALASADEELRDPTRPLDYSVQREAKQPLQLNSILIGNGRRLAVINGQTAEEQQRIDDVQVLRLLTNKVMVQLDGIEMDLTLRRVITNS